MLVAVAVTGGQVGANAATSRPDDYYFASGAQWALAGAPASTNAPAAWCRSTGANILVADIDSGADFSHEDLAGKLIAGAAFVNPSGDTSGQMTGAGESAVSDDNGHGTLTAGLIVANTNNGRGIAAVAPDARALIVKVIGADGRGNPTDIGAGMRWAVDHGAAVLNVSLSASQLVLSGGDAGASPIADAADYAAEHGVDVAFASGNDGSGYNSYQLLEDKPTVLVAGALDRDGTVPGYSNGGASIYAPGGDGYNGTDDAAQVQHNVVSTYAGGSYATAAGTSVATAMVAGVLALLRADGFTAEGARQQILSAARQVGVPMLDAAAAVGAPVTQTCGVATAAPLVKPTPLTRTTPESHLRPPPPTPVATPVVTGRPSASIVLSLPSPTVPDTRVAALSRPKRVSDRAGLVAVATVMVLGTGVAVLGFGRRSRYRSSPRPRDVIRH